MSDDLISKHAAIKELGEKPLAWVEGEYELGLQNQWERDVNAITELPSVDAVPLRRGNWVGIDQEPCEMWECDRCGYVEECEDGEQTDFCPGCGADMREASDDSIPD